MAVRQVLVPERQSAMGSLFSKIGGLANLWTTGGNISTFGKDMWGGAKGLFGGAGAAGGSTGAAPVAGAAGGSGMAAPAAAPAAEASAAPAAAGSEWAGMAGPIGAMAAGTYFDYKGMKSDPSWNYENRHINPVITNDHLWGSGGGPKMGFDGDAISRRLDSKSVGIKDIDFDATKKMIQNLNIDKGTKDSMMAKVGQAANLTKRIV